MTVPITIVRSPIVAVTACKTTAAGVPYETVRSQYIEAVRHYAGANPLVLPTCGRWFVCTDLLARLDGIVLTGSASNVEPSRYGLAGNAEPADGDRDDTTLNLVKPAVKQGVPLLGICRGLQEINVAYGGQLRALQCDEPTMMQHHEDESLPRDKQYRPVHAVRLREGGQLREWLGRDEVRVNSLHTQGIERLGSDLAVEATAPDGLIEAVSVVASPNFCLAVQWHPEWHVRSDPVSQELFRRFGLACRRRMKDRQE